MRRSLATLSLAGALAAQEPAALEAQGTLSPDFPVADIEARDLDGDGSDELIVIGVHGEVRIWQMETAALTGELVLPEPTRSLVAFASLRGDQRRHLVVFDPNGILAYEYRQGAFRGPASRLVGRERFTMRVGRPRFSAITQDVNADGLADLVLPSVDSCVLYLNRGPGAGAADAPEYIRASRLLVPVSTSTDTSGDALSESLSSSFVIPDLRTSDVNGDGRADLLAVQGQRHLYYLQAADGQFSEQPDVTLDLAIFRDTTPEASIEFGTTLGIENATLHSRDLNGDAIPDYVIAHRRKVWVFHSTDQGPQFEDPSSILKLAEDVTLLLLMHLDADEYPDLLMFKLQVPSLGTLFKGLLFEWDIDIGSLGYANQAGKTFARKPQWKSETTIRLPSIMSLIKKPEAILDRFQEVGRKFRLVVTADLNGDGRADILMQSEDLAKLQFWLMETDTTDPQSADRYLRGLLFEQEDRVWDIDRILDLLRSMAEDRRAQLTLNRQATGSFSLRDPDFYRLEKVIPADLNGDGRAEIIAQYRSVITAGQSEIDLLRMH